MQADISLKETGLQNVGKIYRNLTVPKLVEESLKRGEGLLAKNGSLLVTTGERTGRSPNDKYIVKRSPSAENIWWGDINVSTEADHFERLYAKARSYLQNRDLFVFDGFCGADPDYRISVRIVSPLAWHGLFSETLFIRPSKEELDKMEPDFTLVNVSEFLMEPEKDGINSGTYIGIDFERKLALVAGSGYGGEIKKSMFTVMNYLMPLRNIMSMHGSANVGRDGRVALFFGLSGTGKTTLSADKSRSLIGDDEHGWSDNGIFNFEGGCYAKCIRLSKEDEPQIYNAISFGSLLENVVYDPETREVDYDGDDITENTRATYPVEHIPGCITEGRGGHPSDIFFLAADAFGVLPPIARLDEAHAMYHFLSGYTAKLAGTESGIDEPTATFSACFGEPFMPQHPARYAELLGERIEKHGVRVWLVNTGWSGGPYGVGERMSIKHTRALLDAALTGKLDDVKYHEDPVFKINIPDECPGVPSEVLIPRNTWEDKDAYDTKARELAGLFMKNFEKYASGASEEIRWAGPKV